MDNKESILKQIEQIQMLKALAPETIKSTKIEDLKAQLNNMIAEYKCIVSWKDTATDDEIFEILSHIAAVYGEYYQLRKDRDEYNEAMSKLETQLLQTVLQVDSDIDITF